MKNQFNINEKLAAKICDRLTKSFRRERITPAILSAIKQYVIQDLIYHYGPKIEEVWHIECIPSKTNPGKVEVNITPKHKIEQIVLNYTIGEDEWILKIN